MIRFTELILERAGEFDIVALQEAFSQQADQLIDGALAGGFFALPGSGPREWRLPIEVSIGAQLASIPLQSSGLFLLVRRDLYTPPIAISGPAGQLAQEVMRLAAETTGRSSSPPIATASPATARNCMAQKGFTLSTELSEHPTGSRRSSVSIGYRQHPDRIEFPPAAGHAQFPTREHPYASTCTSCSALRSSALPFFGALGPGAVGPRRKCQAGCAPPCRAADDVLHPNVRAFASGWVMVSTTRRSVRQSSGETSTRT